MSSLKRTTYKALMNEAQAVVKTHFYTVTKMTKTPEEDPAAFLGHWIPGNMNTVFYDKTIGELATNILKAVKEETQHIPSITEQQASTEAYKIPMGGFQCDKIELEMDNGELIDVDIYHTPNMAAFNWEIDGMFHNGFALTIGYTVVLLKGGNKWF